jgi:hypothetical protein
VRVLFSRHQNDFEHIYDLDSVPRVGERVGLLPSPIMSAPEVFEVISVFWSPDHTDVDVSVGLKRLW